MIAINKKGFKVTIQITTTSQIGRETSIRRTFTDLPQSGAMVDETEANLTTNPINTTLPHYNFGNGTKLAIVDMFYTTGYQSTVQPQLVTSLPSPGRQWTLIHHGLWRGGGMVRDQVPQGPPPPRRGGGGEEHYRGQQPSRGSRHGRIH